MNIWIGSFISIVNLLLIIFILSIISKHKSISLIIFLILFVIFLIISCWFIIYILLICWRSIRRSIRRSTITVLHTCVVWGFWCLLVIWGSLLGFVIPFVASIWKGLISLWFVGFFVVTTLIIIILLVFVLYIIVILIFIFFMVISFVFCVFIIISRSTSTVFGSTMTFSMAFWLTSACITSAWVIFI